MRLRFLALALVASACTAGSGRVQAPESVGTVNGEAIGAAEVKAAFDADARDADGAARAPGELRSARRRALDALVDRKMLLQEARAHSVRVTDDEVERALLRLRADYPGDTFDKLLADEQLSPQDLRRQIKDNLTVERLFADEVFARLALTDADVDAWLEKHGSELDQPERVRATQIVVKTEEEAKRLRNELMHGADFGELARRYSLSPDARVGGDLGFFARDQMPPPFGETCFALRPGQVSEVVGSPYGFHLFKVLERKAAVKPPDAERRKVAERKVRRENEAEAQEAYLTQLRAKAKILIDEAAFRRLAENP